MQALASEAVSDPVYGLVAAALVVMAAVVLAMQAAARRRKVGNPLQGLFDPSTFDQRIDSVAERTAHMPRGKVLRRGQRAQMARLTEVWELDEREQAIEEIARVMRVKRGSDSFPVRMVKAAADISDSEWEEVKLLPAPAPSKGHSEAA